MKKILFFISLSVITIFSYSQKFMYQATIPTVDSSGFYHIFLPPEVTAKLNYKFSDIRIYDKKGKEVPYLHMTFDELYKTARKRELHILSNQYKRQKKFTQVIVHNKKLLKINNLVLIVNNPKNAEAWVNIAGSNDRKMWNVLKTNSRYLPEFSDSSTTEVRINDLPETKYEYYRILIYDFGKTIFSVKNVFNYDVSNRNIDYVEVMKPSFSQDDTTDKNKTIVKITFSEPQYVDKIKFFITYPPYYLRKAELSKKDSLSGRKIKLKLYDQSQKDFYLCSDSSNTLLLSRYFVEKMFLTVYNNDDEPLKFSEIRAYQKKEYIIAYLKKNKKYVVRFGNKNVSSPIYDLKFFKYKIPPKCPVVSVTNIKKITLKTKKNKNVSIPQSYLWIVFGLVLVVLILISLKMFVLTKNNQKTDELV